MMAANVRLLSPMRRRLYPNARTGTRISKRATITLAQRKGLEPGQPDSITWDALKLLGWVEYRGPAQTDENGYIIPGTDPALPAPR